MNRLVELFIAISLVALLGCAIEEEKSVVSSGDAERDNDTLVFHRLEKEFQIGDFDRDKKVDTDFTHNYSTLENHGPWLLLAAD